VRLLIDDLRNFDGIDVVARTYESGKKILGLGDWTHLYLDNNLGDLWFEGVDILQWVFETAPAIVPNFVQLVTSNPIARERMDNLLRDNGFIRQEDINFLRKKED
jgi:hypothetical protein